MIPNVDDGATSEHDALAMLRILEEEGVTHVVATPHVPAQNGRALAPGDILRRIVDLNSAAERHDINVTVLPGSEIRFESRVLDLLARDEVLPINGTSYILLELPLYGDWPPYVRSTIFDLQIAGFLPILAHVERYPGVQKDPDVLQDLISTGVLMQINADSVVGAEHDPSARTARHLIQSRMAHIVATDAHSPEKRAPRIRSAMDRVAELSNREYADWIASVSSDVAFGRTVYLPEPVPKKRKRWWSRVRPASTG